MDIRCYRELIVDDDKSKIEEKIDRARNYLKTLQEDTNSKN